MIASFHLAEFSFNFIWPLNICIYIQKLSFSARIVLIIYEKLVGKYF